MGNKQFAGARLRRLRRQRGMSQAAMATRMGLSLSYVCQLENDQRPVTPAVLLKLSEAFQCDLADFADTHDRRLMSELQTVLRDRTVVTDEVAPADLGRLVDQAPELAATLVSLYHRHVRLHEDYRQLVHRFYGDEQRPPLAPLPHEEVRDFFNRRQNYVDRLDRAAEELAARLRLVPGSRAAALAAELASRRNVRVVFERDGLAPGELRRLDPDGRRLHVAPSLNDGQQAFQIATQLALTAYGDLIEAEVREAGLVDEESQALARHGLAHYFAGATLMPYRAFLGAAGQSGYDIEALQQQFHVGFESVCHRLSTIQRPGARGVPFYFVRVDQAGNISKRQSAAPFHFAQQGGACPLWHVHDAFSQPGRILTQVAEMPDGTRFFGLARTIERGGGGYHEPRKVFAVGLGCEVSHADALVYARGLDLRSHQHVVPIGPGCRVCPRTNCAQRAFPPVGKYLETDTNSESLVSYRFVDEPAPMERPSRGDRPRESAAPRATAPAGPRARRVRSRS